MTKIFVGGFPLDITELELVQMLSWHGTVSTIKIVRDKKTRICKGYAFVEMTDRAGAENAVLALNGTMLLGRELTLNITEEAPAKPVMAPRKSYTKPAVNEPAGRPKRPRRPIS
ncbi:RNA recognition motif domain-containing protein [Mucilaginibacter phyllosphaerae]|nr:RNA-binding protein [Mucilaginibacter phyllosphaerae]MBB3967700.1 RNA recognition motif-containing protein [Mucilaginibacter phyllosphaerae]GGH03898.1 hypothetical protein GCM10007352_06790 [Mucilaginibacter phyllosphaerae]